MVSVYGRWSLLYVCVSVLLVSRMCDSLVALYFRAVFRIRVPAQDLCTAVCTSCRVGGGFPICAMDMIHTLKRHPPRHNRTLTTAGSYSELKSKS